MMDQNHAEKPFTAKRREQLLKLRQLFLSKLSGPQERCGRQRARSSYKRHVPAPAHEWKRLELIAAHVRAPFALRLCGGLAHIEIVIARHERDVIGRAELFEPRTRGPKLRRKRNVDEIPGDRQMVVLLGGEIAHDRIQYIRTMDRSALTQPVEIAERAFSVISSVRGIGSGARWGRIDAPARTL
jgi:hypothetical protein